MNDADLDFDTIVRMTRAVGQTMDRLAEWEVATLASLLDKSGTGAPARTEALRLVKAIGTQLRGLLIYVWRRHLLAAVARVESLENAEDEQVAQATVGFADLVSFSALTNRLDEDGIGDLVEVFEGRSHDVVSRRGGRVVKTLGDSVLYMAATPEEGVEIAWDIVKVIGGDARLPDVRVGVVTGSRRTHHGRRLRPGGQPRGAAGRRGPAQPGDHRRAHRRAAAGGRSTRPGRCRRARCAGSVT